jgi:CheY-like chemotaxis protein
MRLEVVKKMTQAKRLILVVEDNHLIRLAAVELLIEAGFEVLEAESADEAINILEARRDIHLVFTDVQMPGTMDGVKLSHYIRDRWPPIKLIVASGQSILTESQLPAGARFFAKPYDAGNIIQTILGMLPDPSEQHPSP